MLFRAIAIFALCLFDVNGFPFHLSGFHTGKASATRILVKSNGDTATEKTDAGLSCSLLVTEMSQYGIKTV